jgi:hypothetical protein
VGVSSFGEPEESEIDVMMAMTTRVATAIQAWMALLFHVLLFMLITSS